MTGSAIDDLTIPQAPSRSPADVFTRVVSAPAGAPWEQAHIAELDARLGAPMPVSTLAIRLVRLARWRPGAEARFAVFYARSEAVRRGLIIEREIEGRTLKVSFRSAAEQSRRIRMWGGACLVGIAAICVLAFAGFSAVTNRAGQQHRLASDMRRAASVLHEGQALSAQKKAGDQIRAVGLEGRTIADLMTAMAGAAARRKSDVRFAAFHWDHGYVAVETANAASPFRDSAIKGRQGKGGAWFWGLGQAGAGGSQ